MTNKEIKKDKASVLAVTMIILGLVLSIALSASLVSILGNKASVSSNKSNLAYSRADSGIEDVLLRIKNADPDIDTVANIDTDGNCDGIVNGTNFKVELKDEAGILVSGDCSTKVSEIRSIKSTGIADNNQRSIEVAVATSEFWIEGVLEDDVTTNYNVNIGGSATVPAFRIMGGDHAGSGDVLVTGGSDKQWGLFDNDSNSLLNWNINNQHLGILGSALASHQVAINGTVVGISWDNASDVRYKKNVQTIENPLEKILGLRGVYFDWRNGEFPGKNFPDGQQIGVIAQEVEGVLPQLVKTDDGYKSVNYSGLAPVLVEAMKQQQKQINDLKNQTEELKKEIEILKIK